MFKRKTTRPRVRRWSAKIERLESRQLLAALIGVDFDVIDGALPPRPANWNVADFGTRNSGFDTLLQNKLIDELGEATPIELTITSPVPNSESGVLEFVGNESIAAATLPSRSDGLPTLENLGGWQFVDGAGQTIRVNWRNLSPFTRYDVFVFGLEGDGQNSSQSVSINGGEVSFTQSPTTSGSVSRLWINGQAGTNAPLDDFAVQVMPNSDGQIEILVTATSPRNSAALGGLAIREAERLPILVNMSGDEDDNNPFNGQTTLREAIAIANSRTGADEIIFDNTVFGSPSRLTLASGELRITDSVSIIGPGANQLTIDAGGAFRHFRINDNSSALIDVTLANLTLFGGNSQGSGSGGAIQSSENVTILNSVISGNTTTGANFGGGIFHSAGLMTIRNSTLSGNTSYSGGAIINYPGTGMVIENTTISGNRTNVYAGGAIFNQAPLTIRNSTITNNISGHGAGIFSRYINSSQLVIQNSIIAGNRMPNDTPSDLRGTVPTITHSLVGSNNLSGLTAAAAADANGNLIGTNGAVIDPKLGPLAFNGGTTQTHALLADSPAINAGNNTLIAGQIADQRGAPFVRIADNTVDMGAFERQTLAADSFVVTTLTDELDYSNDDVSLREAINSANGSIGADTITFAADLFTGGPFTGSPGSIELALGELQIRDTVTITGPGQSLLAIDANQRSRVVNVIGGSQIDVTLDGLTITSGRTTGDNQFVNDTHSGGGIRFDSTGTLTLTSSTVSGNSTAGDFAFGGGIFAASGAVTLTGSTVSGNSTEGDSARGGGIFTYTGVVTLTGSTVSGNSTAGESAYGGGILASSGAVTLTGSTVSGNSTAGDSAYGGGIFTSSGAVTLTDSTVSGNSTEGDRAGGSGIFTRSGSVTLTDSTVSGNSTEGDRAGGSGIFADSVAVTLTSSTVSGNSTAGDFAFGGGIYARLGAVTLTGSTVSGNSTAGNYASGGGMFAIFGAVTLTGSTVSGNRVTGANSDGGGVWFDDSVVTIVNSTITGNSATRAGGGLLMLADSPDRKVTIRNTIVAGNTAAANPDFTAPNAPGTNLEVRSSLIGDNTDTTLTASATADTNGNLIGTSTDPIDPLLGPLTLNGGTTQTHALLAGSPAINAGNNALIASQTADQRGAPFDRIANNTVDMGAYERQTLAADSFVVTTLNDELDYSNADVSLREAINSANGSIGVDTITFAADLFTGGPESIELALGELQIRDTVTITGSGQDLLTVDANQQSRVVNVIGGTQIDVTLEGLTITGGRTTGDNQIVNNAFETTHSGGGIRFDSTGTLTLTSSTVSGNSTAGDFAFGGGISAYSGAVTLTGSTVSGNSTAGDPAHGGGISTFSGAVTLIDSTVSGNSTAGDPAHGGGISTFSGAVTLIDSTVSGNSTAGESAYGGGISTFSGAVTLTDSNVSGNTLRDSLLAAAGFLRTLARSC